MPTVSRDFQLAMPSLYTHHELAHRRGELASQPARRQAGYNRDRDNRECIQ